MVLKASITFVIISNSRLKLTSCVMPSTALALDCSTQPLATPPSYTLAGPAAKLLQKVKQPQALGPEQRAYFELASGLVCASRAENGRAEAHLQAALSQSLRTENDRALCEAVLAQLLVARDDLAGARVVVERAVTRECRPAIAARIKALHEQLATASPRDGA
jgi:hypothetical protein